MSFLTCLFKIFSGFRGIIKAKKVFTKVSDLSVFTCSKSAMEKTEKYVKSVQSLR